MSKAFAFLLILLAILAAAAVLPAAAPFRSVILERQAELSQIEEAVR